MSSSSSRGKPSTGLARVRFSGPPPEHWPSGLRAPVDFGDGYRTTTAFAGADDPWHPDEGEASSPSSQISVGVEVLVRLAVLEPPSKTEAGQDFTVYAGNDVIGDGTLEEGLVPINRRK